MSPRGSQRVDRRRRVLVDESRNEAPLTRPRIFRGDDEGPLSRYNEAALHALNAPIARYMPFRAFSLVVWFLAGLLPIMGLMLLDQRRFQIAGWLGQDAIRIFDMRSHGSLTSWCASTTFALATLVILAIYSVRRHRRDDYRARFAVWQWALPVAILASVDSAVGLHGLLQGAFDRTLGPLAWGAGSAWWVVAWGLVVGTAMLRLTFEMSASRRSVGWMIGGAVCYIVSGVLELEVVGESASQRLQCCKIPMLLLGHHLVLFSLVNYARDVIREAMGIVAESSPVEPNADANGAASGKSTKKMHVDTAPEDARNSRSLSAGSVPVENTSHPANEGQESPQRRSSKSGTAKSDQDSSREEEAPPVMKVVSQDGEQPVDMSKLTRAERKRLKKEMRRKKAA